MPATDAGDHLVVVVLGALGQFERDVIQEHTRAGLAATAARGPKGGRKPAVGANKLERARSMIAKGLTVHEAAIRLEIGKTGVASKPPAPRSTIASRARPESAHRPRHLVPKNLCDLNVQKVTAGNMQPGLNWE